MNGDVLKIRSMYVPGRNGFGYRKIAKSFPHISPYTIKKVLNRKTWFHI